MEGHFQLVVRFTLTYSFCLTGHARPAFKAASQTEIVTLTYRSTRHRKEKVAGRFTPCLVQVV
jgi:hypothetical protein